MTHRIPFINLSAQYLSIQPEIDAAIERVLKSGQFILGREVRAFEYEFAEYCGVSHAIAVNSGTCALQLALLACKIGSGDEVITVSHTAVATVAAIEMTGARPVFVDIDPQRYTIDPALLSAAWTPKTRAIIPVHLYGCPADLLPILEFAGQHRLFVIEDCAQAHGADYQKKRVGGWGHLAAFSFYPTKNLGAYGDGGMVLTNDPLLAEQVRMLRQYGWRENHISEQKGLNTRLDELQAAILRVKLSHLDKWNDQRCESANLYRKLLDGIDLELPLNYFEIRHVYHQFVVRHRDRDELSKFLNDRGIQTQVHYPVPVHLQPAYRPLNLPPDSLPVTEKVANSVLSLPITPELSESDIRKICQNIRIFYQK